MRDSYHDAGIPMFKDFLPIITTSSEYSPKRHTKESYRSQQRKALKRRKARK